MYRVDVEDQREDNGARENCLLWQRQTTPKASLEDIYNLVYKSTYYDLMGIASSSFKCVNDFAKWLHKDKEAMEFLLLAKECENIRAEMNSPWYYPRKRDGKMKSLEDVAARAKAYKGKRFRERYLLQAERALLSLRDHDECINLWNALESSLPDNVITRMAAGYVGGAYASIGNDAKALELFCKAGDVTSIMSLTSSSRARNRLDSLGRNIYDLSSYRQYVAKEIRNSQYDYLDDSDRSHMNSLFASCVYMAESPGNQHKDFWYYSAAYIRYLLNDERQASELIAKAERNTKDSYIGESIHVFRIYLDAKLKPYSSGYESEMVGKLSWLDRKIVDNYKEVEELCAEEGIYRLNYNYSFFYWNDMLRKIVLGVICPKLLENGRKASACAFASMADYRLLQLVDKVNESRYDRNGNHVQESMTLSDYRKSRHFNYYDYRNESFNMMNDLSADDLIRYERIVENPSNNVERFLVARGNKDKDYLKEIIGTTLLREMRYSEAARYFSMVPVSFQSHLNLAKYGYFKYDPFSVTRERLTVITDYKMNFARRMADLESEIKRQKDPNRKAMAMFRYATGMKNSVGFCWPLTQYGKNLDDDDEFEFESFSDYYFRGMSQFNEAQGILFLKAESLYSLALKTADDPEVLAQMNLELKNTWTVMNEYPGTRAQKLLLGKCDTYRDYHMEALSRFNGAIWVE